MADDTPTVEQLRQAVIDAAFDSLAGRLDVGDRLDALIAKLRAENAPKDDREPWKKAIAARLNVAKERDKSS